MGDLALAWRGMMQWPLLRWLSPVYATRVVFPDGVARNLIEGTTGPSTANRTSKFDGCMLPEDLVLWQTVELPALGPQEIATALAFQVQTLTPFAPEDTVWGHSDPVAEAFSGGAAVYVAIVSRKLVEAHIAGQRTAKVSGVEHEWWVREPNGQAVVVLETPGALPRKNLSRRWRNVNLLLILVLLGLLGAAAITPTAQLRLRAVQAANSYTALQTAAGDAVKQREQWVKLQQRAQSLQSQLKGSLRPELAILRVTQLLPDNTYLTSLQLQGEKVVITGLTPNSAVLMQQLGAQTGVQAVRAPTAATRQRGADRETFSVEFNLDPTSLGAAP